MEDLPLENRPQEMLLDDDEHDQEEGECDVVDTTRPCNDEPVTETRNKDVVSEKREYLETQVALNSRRDRYEERNNKRPSQDAKSNLSKQKRPLSSTGDVLSSENSVDLTEKGRQRSQSAGKEPELRNHSVQNKSSRQKNDELSKFPKKKSSSSNTEKVDSAKTPKVEVKTKTTSEVTQSEAVNFVKPETKHHGKAERAAPKKEPSERTTTCSSSGSPRKSSHNKQQTVTNSTHSGSKSSSVTDSSHSGTATKSSSLDSTHGPVKKSKEGASVGDNTRNSPTVNDNSRASTKGTSTSGHLPGSSKALASEGEREHKPGNRQLVFS